MVKLKGKPVHMCIIQLQVYMPTLEHSGKKLDNIICTLLMMLSNGNAIQCGFIPFLM